MAEEGDGVEEQEESVSLAEKWPKMEYGSGYRLEIDRNGYIKGKVENLDLGWTLSVVNTEEPMGDGVASKRRIEVALIKGEGKSLQVLDDETRIYDGEQLDDSDVTTKRFWYEFMGMYAVNYQKLDVSDFPEGITFGAVMEKVFPDLEAGLPWK